VSPNSRVQIVEFLADLMLSICYQLSMELSWTFDWNRWN